jgi:hypothetical protein
MIAKIIDDLLNGAENPKIYIQQALIGVQW